MSRPQSRGNQDKMQNQSNNQVTQQKKKEPLPLNERYRDYNLPSGIKNIGNSKFEVDY